MRVLGVQGLQPLHNTEATRMESAAQTKGLENMVALYHETAGKGESHRECELTKCDRRVRFGEDDPAGLGIVRVEGRITTRRATARERVVI